MRSTYLLIPFAALYLGACGDDGGGDDDDHDHDAAIEFDADPGAPDADPTAPDAEPAPDAAPSAVVSVNCASVTPDVEVTTSGFAYSPQNSTIGVGDIVRFTPAGSHDVNSEGNGFDVAFGGVGCFRFDVADTYTFHCTPHGFSGSIIVE